MAKSVLDTPAVMNPVQEASVRRPAPEEIELLAYNFYLRRGAVDGHDLEDWLEAERELVGRPETAAGMAKAQAG
jgi:hypothetical protein